MRWGTQLLFLLALSAVGTAVLVHVERKAQVRARADSSACFWHQVNLADALEWWRYEHGRYPVSLKALCRDPTYRAFVKAHLICPGAGGDSYSESYVSTGQSYTMCCTGGHHEPAGLPPDYPRYSSRRGPAFEPPG